jgi:hypothetical protein
LSISEDEDEATCLAQPAVDGTASDGAVDGGACADDAADGAAGDGDPGDWPGEPGEDVRAASAATKWGMAGLLLAYAGLGSYCVVSALGQATGPDHPDGVTRSVARAPGTAAQSQAAASAASGESAASSRAIVSGKAYAARVFARAQAAAAPKVEMLTAVSATAIGPAGTSGDHPQIAHLVLDRNSATAWVTHWYASAHFGNLKQGTGLVLDMGRMVTVRQVQLALGGSPGFWGADVQIRVGDSPESWNFAPAAVSTDVGGWVSPELPSPVTGRYVQIWFTKLPRDSWGTYQEHVYGVTVHGSVSDASATAASGSPASAHGAHHSGAPFGGTRHHGGGASAAGGGHHYGGHQGGGWHHGGGHQHGGRY